MSWFHSSSLIYKVLCDAHEAGKTFRVIVADSRPKSEGIEAVRRLMKHGIKCTYILISAISYMMQEVCARSAFKNQNLLNVLIHRTVSLF